MHPTKPAQPANNLGHVCPEDPAISVGFINDDISQASEQPSPPCMRRQHRVVQHVWVREDVSGLLPGETTLSLIGIAVKGRNQPIPRPNLAANAFLVVSQGLRGSQVQGTVAV